ncbi:hypothetical protein SANA_27570 [Gottschalkiaceae bacterium SANA]|nr:hypothetical protein SANA_27570 [Gottschalkiaceae bacterium SANA]
MKKLFLIILLTACALSGCNTSSQKINEQTINPTPSEKTEMTSPISEDPSSKSIRESTATASIQSILDKKIEAVQTKNLDLYLSTITTADSYYWNEQKRWFTEMTKDGVRDLKYILREVTLEEGEIAIARVEQTHHYHQNFSISYPLRFIQEEDEWKDAGYNFEEQKTERYTIKYMSGESKVTDFQKIIDTAYTNLASIFSEQPDPNFEIKLFHSRELLRQRTIPTIGWLFTGWGEANESLKLYTGHPVLEPYYGTVQHELVHHITMRICNNNLPGWIADGIALQYGNYALEGGNAITLGYATKDQVRVTVDFLENVDLWDAEKQEETWDWYNASQMLTEYIIESYGHDQLMALFYEAGKKPYNENVMNPKFNEQNNKTMGQVLQTVLGITKEELTEAYWTWLDQTYPD